MVNLQKNSKNTPENQQIQELLKGFNLSANESNVYLSSLKLGNSLVKDIAKEAELNRTTTYNILLELRKFGLVASYQKNKLTYFSPSSPSTLRDIANQRIGQQEQLKTKLNELLPLLNGLFQSRSRGSTVKIYEGFGSLAEIYYSVYQNVKYPVEGLEFTNWGGKYSIFPKLFRDEIQGMLVHNRINVRSLLIEDELTSGWYEKDKGRSQSKNIKLLPNPGWDFFCNLELCENRLAIVTYKNDADLQGIVIESTELASMFRFMFESLWSSLNMKSDKVS